MHFRPSQLLLVVSLVHVTGPDFETSDPSN